MDYQLVAPGDHRLLSVERKIQTFKNHFIAVHNGMDSNFLKLAWYHALYKIVITLNMLRSSQLNSKLSAFMQVHGNHNFNNNSLAPVGCKIIIHNRTSLAVQPWFTWFLCRPCYQTLQKLCVFH